MELDPRMLRNKKLVAELEKEKALLAEEDANQELTSVLSDIVARYESLVGKKKIIKIIKDTLAGVKE